MHAQHLPSSRFRRGTAAVLAMLYLVLFSTLSIGFYASVTGSVQIAANEQRGNRALFASESGMEFMKFHLAELEVPAGTSSDQLFNQVYTRLSNRLDGHPNMGGQTVEMSGDGNFIYVPGGTENYINVDAQGGRFRAVLEKLQGGQQVRVKVIGRYGTTEGRRAVRLDYAVAQNASSIFNFGVASRSAIHMNSNARIIGASSPGLGSVLSTTGSVPTLDMEGNSEISGDVSFTNPGAQLLMDSNSVVAGYRSSNSDLQSHIHYGVPDPEFPTIDSSAFAPYATNVLSVVGKKYDSGTLKNIRIAANTNPTFDSNIQIQGVIYIETPNQVTFSSNTEITGAIVVQNDPTGNTLSNTLHFNSNARILPINTLPDTSDFPLELRQLTGSTILAPTFAVTFNSNFGTTGGSIVAGKMHFDSNAQGVVKGSVINLEDTLVQMNSNAEITIESQGTSNYPAGVFFGSHYAPLPHTYAEVLP